MWNSWGAAADCKEASRASEVQASGVGQFAGAACRLLRAAGGPESVSYLSVSMNAAFTDVAEAWWAFAGALSGCTHAGTCGMELGDNRGRSAGLLRILIVLSKSTSFAADVVRVAGRAQHGILLSDSQLCGCLELWPRRQQLRRWILTEYAFDSNARVGQRLQLPCCSTQYLAADAQSAVLPHYEFLRYVQSLSSALVPSIPILCRIHEPAHKGNIGAMQFCCAMGRAEAGKFMGRAFIGRGCLSAAYTVIRISALTRGARWCDAKRSGAL